MSSASLPRAVAGEVRAEMARQQISQQRVADVLKVSRQAFNRRITGDIPFDVAELEKIAEFLGVPVTNFMPSRVVAA